MICPRSFHRDAVPASQRRVGPEHVQKSFHVLETTRIRGIQQSF